jgi:hypothetical protein
MRNACGDAHRTHVVPHAMKLLLDAYTADALKITMLSYLQSLYIVLFSVGAVLCVMHLLNKTLTDDARKRANSVNGWQLSILGSIYAVALGFMLSDAWIAYQTASGDARNEASAALTIYRTSEDLPATCTSALQDAVHQYVVAVDTVEWPAMDDHQANFPGAAIVRRMWGIVNHCDLPQTSPARDSAMKALEALQMHRDSRVEDYDGHLPPMMWTVLIFGGVIVVTSSCLLGNEKKSIHCFHVLSLTVLVTVTLLTISDLDRPFEGATRVGPQAFRTVLTEINQPPINQPPTQ